MALGATDREIDAFITAIIDGKSQREAYRIARPLSKKWKDESVDVRASDLFNQVKVKLRYQELLQKAKEAAEPGAIADAKEVLERITQIVRGETTEEIVMPVGKEQEIKRINKRVPEGIRLKALELLAKHYSLLVERKEIAGRDGGPLEFVWVGEDDTGGDSL